MKKFLLLITLILSTSTIFAYDFLHPMGGRAAAMGGSSVASQGLWALQNNPAGMAELEKISLGLYYENRWLLPETAYKCGAFALPTKFGTLGLSFNQFGSSKYNENKFGLAYAKGFGRYLQIGLQLDYLLLKVGNDYGTFHAFTFELGLQSHVTDKLTLGAYIFNPISFSFKQTLNHEKLPIVFRFGLACVAAWNMRLSRTSTSAPACRPTRASCRSASAMASALPKSTWRHSCTTNWVLPFKSE